MPTSYALLSTYPPTQCGLATFTAALLTHLGQPGDQVAVVRVLDEPTPPSAAEPGEVVHDLVAGSAASASAAAEVLNGFDVVIVQHEYGTDPEKVFVIPHGAADNRVSAAPTGTGRPMVLTWGLLGPGKGIEYAIDSMALLRERGLREAVTAGKPVVSTCFPHAVELLGAGLLVDRQDPAGIARALQRALIEPGLSARMSRYSADLAPQMLWPAVAHSYRELASLFIGARAGTPV